MAKVTQLCVGLDNKPGALAKLCGRLIRAKVNILAVSVVDSTDCCWVRFVASPTAAAKAALKKAGYEVCTQRVLRLTVPHKPGVLEGVASKLAKKGVNINYVYGSNAKGPESTLVVSVDDLEKGAKAVGG